MLKVYWRGIIIGEKQTQAVGIGADLGGARYPQNHPPDYPFGWSYWYIP